MNANPIATLSTIPGRAAHGAKSPAQVAEGFEALFLYQLLEPLEKSGGAFFGNGPEGRTFASLFRQQIADQVAHQRPLGIADRVEKALRAYQNGANPTEER